VAEYEGDGMYHMHFRVLDGLIFWKLWSYKQITVK
jgi:hypothetical protein